MWRRGPSGRKWRRLPLRRARLRMIWRAATIRGAKCFVVGNRATDRHRIAICVVRVGRAAGNQADSYHRESSHPNSPLGWHFSANSPEPFRGHGDLASSLVSPPQQASRRCGLSQRSIAPRCRSAMGRSIAAPMPFRDRAGCHGGRRGRARDTAARSGIPISFLEHDLPELHGGQHRSGDRLPQPKGICDCRSIPWSSRSNSMIRTITGVGGAPGMAPASITTPLAAARHRAGPYGRGTP